MNTVFYYNAKTWTDESQRDLNNNRYLSSWTKTIPARLNYVIDAILNFVMLPLNLLKACYQMIRFIYTWGRENLDIKNTALDLEGNLNHVVSDLAGVILIQLGVSLRDKPNIPIMIFATSFFMPLSIAFINSF